MVFIGRELDREAFQEAFEHCLVSEWGALMRTATDLCGKYWYAGVRLLSVSRAAWR
jgi:hypothetical protein